MSRIRIVHKGRDAQRKALDVIQGLDAIELDDVDDISRLKNFSLGDTDDAVVAEIFDRKILGRKVSHQVLELAKLDADMTDSSANPRSAWGYAQGLTRYSQMLVNGYEREEVERAAPTIFALAK